MKKTKKWFKIIIIILILLIIFILGFLIYKNLFQEGVSERLEGIESYSLTKEEIKLVKDKLGELENIESIDIDTNYKIIKIFLELKEDVKFEDVKKISNEAITNFSEENLSFYDIELFVTSLSEESLYPKVGYKHKTNSEFTWNRWFKWSLKERKK